MYTFYLNWWTFEITSKKFLGNLYDSDFESFKNENWVLLLMALLTNNFLSSYEKENKTNSKPAFCILLLFLEFLVDQEIGLKND